MCVFFLFFSQKFNRISKFVIQSVGMFKSAADEGQFSKFSLMHGLGQFKNSLCYLCCNGSVVTSLVAGSQIPLQRLHILSLNSVKMLRNNSNVPSHLYTVKSPIETHISLPEQLSPKSGHSYSRFIYWSEILLYV